MFITQILADCKFCSILCRTWSVTLTRPKLGCYNKKQFQSPRTLSVTWRNCSAVQMFRSYVALLGISWCILSISWWSDLKTLLTNTNPNLMLLRSRNVQFRTLIWQLVLWRYEIFARRSISIRFSTKNRDFDSVRFWWTTCRPNSHHMGWFVIDCAVWGTDMI